VKSYGIFDEIGCQNNYTWIQRVQSFYDRPPICSLTNLFPDQIHLPAAIAKCLINRG